MSNQHCGFCVPCIIRRASLNYGLGIDDPTIYTLDNLNGTFDSRKRPGENFRSFKLAANHALSHPESLRYLVQKSGPLPKEGVEEYARMYQQGMKEVAELLKMTRAVHE